MHDVRNPNTHKADVPGSRPGWPTGLALFFLSSYFGAHQKQAGAWLVSCQRPAWRSAVTESDALWTEQRRSTGGTQIASGCFDTQLLQNTS